MVWNWFQTQIWAQVVAGVLAYLVLAVGTYQVTKYYLGSWPAEKVFRVVGFPLIVIVNVCGILYNLFSAPGRYRTRRLFVETFGCGPFSNEARGKVDTKLRTLALSMNECFDNQEKTRTTATNREAKMAKKTYWDASHLAQKFSIHVPASWRGSL